MPPVLRHRNKELHIDLGSLLAEALAETKLIADAAAGAGTLSIPNLAGLAINQILLIGELGQEGSEIIKTHASTAPTGTTLTLASNLVRAHTSGTRVRVIKWDQFELSHAATIGGSKTVLTVANGNPPSALGTGLIAIDPGASVQHYSETEHTSGFYFARFKNSITATFSAYTDGLAFGGWAADTVGYLIEKSLSRLGLVLSAGLTLEYLMEEGVNECLRLIKGKQIKYPEHSVFGYTLAPIEYGENRWELPADIYDRKSKKSIMTVRVGKGRELRWVDPATLDNEMQGQFRTEVRTQAVAADTSLAVENSYNFAESGTVHVYVAGVRYDVEYTGITRDDADGATGALTGIPAAGAGSITTTLPVGSIVRQGDYAGTARYYTIKDGYLEVAGLPSGVEIGQSVSIDYDRVATTVDSQGDTIDADRYDMVLEYTTWKAKMKARNDGNLNMEDGYYVAFRERLNDSIRTKQSNKKTRWTPNVNTVKVRKDQRGH